MLYLAVGAALLAALSFFGYRLFSRTAYIVVHPWNFGRSLAEAKHNVDELRKLTHVAEIDLTGLMQKHEEYYSRLRQGLRRLFCRYVVIVEHPENEDDTAEQMLKIVPPYCRLIMVDSRIGRATPAYCSWDQLLKTLCSMKIRYVCICGSYLGLHKGMIVRPEVQYYCVNDMFYHLSEARTFRSVTVQPELCYTNELAELPVTPNPPGTDAHHKKPLRWQPKDSKKRNKKGKKRR